VFDGVDECLLNRELDTEYVVLVNAAGLQMLLDGILNPARFGGIAGDGDFRGKSRTDIARELHGVGNS
jgi:hypothetical protein